MLKLLTSVSVASVMLPELVSDVTLPVLPLLPVVDTV